MHTGSYEFLMKPKESAECHWTLSSWVGSGHKTSRRKPYLTYVNFIPMVIAHGTNQNILELASLGLYIVMFTLRYTAKILFLASSVIRVIVCRAF